MAVTYEVVTELVEVEEVPEKLPESPWHNENVRRLEDILRELVSAIPRAAVFRDLYFHHNCKRYAPDLAVVLTGAPPIEKLGAVYRVPEDGPSPDAVIEIAVSPKSLGEALSEKAEFYAGMGVKDYLVVEAFPNKSMKLWTCRIDKEEPLSRTNEARLETLKIVVRAEGQRLRVFDENGQEILSPRDRIAVLEAELEKERQKRQELERRLAELEQRSK